MSSLFRPTTIEDEAQVIEFLARNFSVDRDASFLSPALLRWKYWHPRPDFSGPRAFVMERDGRIASHAGIWPVTVRWDSKAECGVHMIDWASDPAAPGAGVALLQRLAKSYDFVFGIGGSEMTRSIFPKFGFDVVATAVTFARPLRPWRQIRDHQIRDARLPLRLARNLVWSRVPGVRPNQDWTVSKTGDRGAAAIDAAANQRDEAFFRYLESCPSAPFTTFQIFHRGEEAGGFVLTVLHEQARLAGIWLVDQSPETWRTALQLVQVAALRYTPAVELVGRMSSDAAVTGAVQSGMRVRTKTPVFLFRK